MRKGKAIRFNLIVASVVFIIQLGLAITPFFPWTARYWHSKSPQDFYNEAATFLGIELLLLTAAITLILSKAAQDQADAASELRSALPSTVVRKLKDSDFYSQFRLAAEEAQNSVRISYLAPYPPTDVPYKARKKYYDEMLELMKQRTGVSFKRLVRASPQNDQWVAHLIQRLKGSPNVEIALLTEDLPPKDKMPLALSVQVVDDHKTWLVAVESHETESDFRDIYVENADVCRAMSNYFERLWQVSEVLLDHGRITPDGEEVLRRVGEGR